MMIANKRPKGFIASDPWMSPFINWRMARVEPQEGQAKPVIFFIRQASTTCPWGWE